MKDLLFYAVPAMGIVGLLYTMLKFSWVSKQPAGNDRMKENMVERHPMKGYLQPEEVANMADFLISEKAKSISGQIFEMDYGIVSFKI